MLASVHKTWRDGQWVSSYLCMNVGDLVGWNDDGWGFIHLVDCPTTVHDDYIEDRDNKITGIVINYYGDNPESPDSEGHVKVLWNDESITVTSVGLLRVLSKC